MDLSLFAKYKKVVEKREDDKELLIDLIKKESGVELKQEEIMLENKKITLNISSIKRMRLFKGKIKEILKEKGFIL